MLPVLADAAVAIDAAQKRVAAEAADIELDALHRTTDAACSQFVRYCKDSEQSPAAIAGSANDAIRAIDAEIAGQEQVAEKGPRMQMRQQVLLAQRRNIQYAVSQRQSSSVALDAGLQEAMKQPPQRRTTKRRLGSDYSTSPQDLLKDSGSAIK